MFDLELQRQLRALMPGQPKRQTSCLPILASVAAITAALTFTAVLYIGEIHKIPMTTALTRLEHMLAECRGTPTAEIRQQTADRAGRRYPAFTMAEQLDAIQYALDMLEAGHCVKDAGEGHYVIRIFGLQK